MAGSKKRELAEDEYLLTAPSLHEVARCCQVNLQSIVDWIRDGKIRRRKVSKRRYVYDLVGAVRHSAVADLERQHAAELRRKDAEIERLKAKLEAKGEVSDIDEATKQMKLQKLRLETHQKALHVEQLKNDLIPREHVAGFLEVWASRMRECGELAQKHFGDDAQQIVHDVLDSVEAALEGMWHSIEIDPRHPKNGKYSNGENSEKSKTKRCTKNKNNDTATDA